MQILESKKVEIRGFGQCGDRLIARVSTKPDLPKALREQQLFLRSNSESPEGFLGYIDVDGLSGNEPDDLCGNVVKVSSDFQYLTDGDVVRIEPRNMSFRVLYRRNTSNNSLLLTERCNNLCLMCSQPPKNIDDSWHIDEVIQVLRLADRSSPEIILSGGEPTLLGDDLFRIVRAAESYLPDTALHILSNGRRFADLEFAKAYAATRHHDVMVGIPLYSDLSTIHDYVVQADGAFDETVRGILNLKRCSQRVEIRVVVHKQTYSRLPQLADFIARNLTFVDHVAFMGLEMTGFTLANLEDLWIDPWDCREQVAIAANRIDAARIRASIYNHQLCVLPESAWRFSQNSISDWKNEYFGECSGCSVREACGGFFSSATLRRSEHIRAVQ